MATQSNMSSTKNVVSLLGIPLEIRVNIYRNLLVTSDSMNRIRIWSLWKNVECLGIFTSILFTCKQVAFEATHILYASNTFDFEEPEDMSNWLDVLNPENVQAVRKAEISGSCYMADMDVVKEILRRCTGLWRFHFDWFSPSFRSPPGHFYEIFEWTKEVLKDHVSLTMVACENWKTKHESKGQAWKSNSITLIANIRDVLPKDGELVDIEKAIEQYVESTNDKHVHSLI